MEIIIEKDQRLSQSALWDLQTAAYCQFGPQAWMGKGVPFYPTSNPYIARQYAQVVIGYLRDCLQENSPTPIDPSKTVYLLDLGAGSGRFGYLFLKSLLGFLPILKKTLKIRYVMTDIAQKNIEFWKGHPYLQPFIEKGILDFAFYSHREHEKPIELLISGDVLSSSTLTNPLILIGNYFFDTIPQDLFLAKEGEMLEGRISLRMDETPQTKKLNPNDPAVINHLKTSFDYVPIADIDAYYPDSKELSPILKSYAKRFDNIPILFPVGAFQAIKYFTQLSQGRFLLLAGDQGRCTEKQLEDFKEPYIAKHGSFSIPVNYHAIEKYFRSQQGVTMITTHPQPTFVVTASILGGQKENYLETAYAFRNHIDFFEPNDYFLLLDYTEKEWLLPDLEAMLLLIKLGNWDPVNFHFFFERIMKELPKASKQAKENLGQTIHCVWENFFPINMEEASFVMNLGVIFFAMARYEEALIYFERALKLKEGDPLILGNMSVCYDKLGKPDLAKQFKKMSKDKK